MAVQKARKQSTAQKSAGGASRKRAGKKESTKRSSPGLMSKAKKAVCFTAYLLLALLTGCSPITRRVDKTLLEVEGRARVMAMEGEWFHHSRPCSLTVQTIDGISESWHSSYPLVPGAHTFGVSVQWSNGWQDQTALTFRAQPAKRYWILSYELAPGEPEERAEIRQHTKAEEASLLLLKGVMFAPVVILSPFVVGGALGYQGVQKLLGEETREQVTGRPFERCCFVWIQDEETGEVVAGERPRMGAGDALPIGR